MTGERLKNYHLVLTPEQLARAKQRGDVDGISEVPAGKDSLMGFAQAVRKEKIQRNHEQPHYPEPIPSIPQIVDEVAEAMEGGSVPVEVACSPQVLDIITAQ